MALDDLAARNFNIDPQSFDGKDVEEIKVAMEDLAEVDLGFGYSLEKMVNLDNLLMHLLACDNDFESVSIEDDNFPEDFVEKALSHDFLHAVLVTEVKELDNFISSLQALTVASRDKIFSSEKSIELYNVVGDKLQDREETLKQTQERIIEMKMQLAKLQMNSLTLNQSEWDYNTKIGFSEVSGINLKPQMQTIDKRLVLRMLEKFLARELDLEKKLSELRHNDEDLKLKIHLTEQVAMCMEEAAEVTWARFLEAENAVEILMGTSKEMVGRLQTAHFHLNSSATRKQELKVRLEHCNEQLNAKETAIQKLNSSIVTLMAENSELSSLREKVKLLEKKLKESNVNLKEANARNEASQEQIREMDAEIESLKENINAAGSREQDAESRITQLTDANMELTEELNFLKARNDRNAEKISSLEKQLRESEQQLQHARASSEVTQEQQTMLYSAIWDMETMIDELKQKASKSEFKIKNMEDQCTLLKATNLELNKELDIMRARVEFLEMSLDHATSEKIASAKDVNIKTNLIMDIIIQLTIERERIQKQLYLLRKENKILLEKLPKASKNSSANSLHNGGIIDPEFPPSQCNSVEANSTQTYEETAAESSPICSQTEKPSSTTTNSQSEILASVSGDDSSKLAQDLEPEAHVQPGGKRQMYILMAAFVLLLSVSAAFLFDKNRVIFTHLFN